VSIIPATLKVGAGGSHSEAGLGESVRLYLKASKLKNSKRTGGMSQVLEHLLSKCVALSSIPSIGEREKGKETNSGIRSL
jgi:hypothetical protein